MLVVEIGGWSPGPAAITGAAELAGMLLVEFELGGWSAGRPTIAGAVELAGMLLVELGGWPLSRWRSPTWPSSPACSWSSSAAGHKVSGDHRPAEFASMPEFELGGWSPARRRSPAWARLVTRSAAIVDAAELAGILELKLELGGWSPGPAAITGAAELAGMLLVELELGGRPSAGPRLHVSTWSPYRRLSTFSHLAPTTGFAPRAADNWTLVAKKEHADRVPAAAGQLPRRLDKGNMAKGHSNSRANATAALAAVEPEP